VLIVGRVIDGLTAGNFSAAFAALGDSTRAEDRGRNFGYLGASAGAGFIAGPAVGGLLAHFGPSAPLYVAAALCLANALFGFFFMPETRPSDLPSEPLSLVRLNPLTQLRSLLEVQALRPLLAASVLFTVPFAMMTTLLALLSKDRLAWSATQASTVFIAVGLCDVAVQGALLGRLLKRLSERQAALLGLALAATGLAGMALIQCAAVHLADVRGGRRLCRRRRHLHCVPQRALVARSRPRGARPSARRQPRPAITRPNRGPARGRLPVRPRA
jgi:MFS transporter, DHA1 family, tetracycline resistance protein